MKQQPQAGDIALYIEPTSPRFEQDRLFDAANARPFRDDLLAPFRHVRDWFTERGVPVHTADRLMRGRAAGRVNILVSFGSRRLSAHLGQRPDVILSAFFAFEPPVVDPALYRALARISRQFKRTFCQMNAETIRPLTHRTVAVESFHAPYPRDDVRDDLWSRSSRHRLVMINGNILPALKWRELYTERRRAIAYFADHGGLDLYGRGWDAPPFDRRTNTLPRFVQRVLRAGQAGWQRLRPVPWQQSMRRVYRGVSASKLVTLASYTFCICFENASFEGYVSEKLFDCFVAGTVPIYLGAPNIRDVVSPRAFIDMRQFTGYDDLGRYLESLSPSAIDEFREAGRAFLRSPSCTPFRMATFTQRLARIVEEDAGVSLGTVA
jgi:hypothetical protein